MSSSPQTTVSSESRTPAELVADFYQDKIGKKIMITPVIGDTFWAVVRGVTIDNGAIVHVAKNDIPVDRYGKSQSRVKCIVNLGFQERRYAVVADFHVVPF